MEPPWRAAGRPRRSAAERRAQAARAQFRAAQALLRGFHAMGHRGCRPTLLGEALANVLRAAGGDREARGAA
eukprot:2528089-Pyramimonas_sp.AAC.1